MAYENSFITNAKSSPERIWAGYSFETSINIMEQNNIPSLEEWVESDLELNKKTTELFESDLPIEVQAQEALQYLIQVYGLP
jgi:hypothetical protein